MAVSDRVATFVGFEIGLFMFEFDLRYLIN